MTFRGGIQPGTTASSKESRELDRNVKTVAKKLLQEYTQFRVIKRFSHAHKMQWVGEDCFGFQPDGYAWFINDQLVAVFEAKKQGIEGNVQERWWDNACTAQFINKDVRYHTWCRGEGCVTGGPLHQLSRKAQLMLGTNFTFSLSQTGFTLQEIESQMRSTLEEVLNLNPCSDSPQ